MAVRGGLGSELYTPPSHNGTHLELKNRVMRTKCDCRDKEEKKREREGGKEKTHMSKDKRETKTVRSMEKLIRAPVLGGNFKKRRTASLMEECGRNRMRPD